MTNLTAHSWYLTLIYILAALFIVRQLIPSFTRAVESSLRVVAIVQTMAIVILAFIDVAVIFILSMRAVWVSVADFIVCNTD